MTRQSARCHVCGDEITDWGFGDWHHVPSPDEDAYLKGHDHDASHKAGPCICWLLRQARGERRY